MLDEALNTGPEAQNSDAPIFGRSDGVAAGWAVSPGQVPYPEAVAAMEARVAAMAAGQAGELVWLLEHPPLYTGGVSAKPGDLLDAGRFPVFETGRGGQFTYHGPGQRVAYLMLDLNARRRDVRSYVRALEAWIIGALDHFNVEGRVIDGRVGVWTDTQKGEAKIAAIGVKVRKWVSFHGISLNVEPDLSHFAGIVPCGISDAGVTSLVDLGRPIGMADADAALQASFHRVFGATVEAAPPL